MKCYGDRSKPESELCQESSNHKSSIPKARKVPKIFEIQIHATERYAQSKNIEDSAIST